MCPSGTNKSVMIISTLCFFFLQIFVTITCHITSVGSTQIHQIGQTIRALPSFIEMFLHLCLWSFASKEIYCSVSLFYAPRCSSCGIIVLPFTIHHCYPHFTPGYDSTRPPPHRKSSSLANNSTTHHAFIFNALPHHHHRYHVITII